MTSDVSWAVLTYLPTVIRYSYILRRPQNFAKSTPYFCPIYSASQK